MAISRFLVDTSVWLLVLRKNFLPAVKDRIDYLLKEDLIMTNGIVKLEILGGVKNENDFKRLKKRLDALEVVEINSPLWERAYALAFNLRRKGITIPYTDILIASCALASESTVVHADTHFDLMSRHIGLKVESFIQNIRDIDR
jgi:predicted nucleic acid-binding protein